MHLSRHLLTLGLLTTLGLGLPRVSSALAEEPQRVVQSSVNRDFEPIDIRGRLDETSNVADDGRYFNIHVFDGTEGQPLVIDLISETFDSVLYLGIELESEFNWIDPDFYFYEGDATHARIVVVLPMTGTYHIATTSTEGQEIGDYQLTVRPAPASDFERAELLEEANGLNQQVLQLYEEGRYEEAIPLAQRALEIRETALGESHPHVATSLNNLAALYRDQGNYSAAEPLFLRSLEILETALGESHPHVATSLNNLAELYGNQGKLSCRRTSLPPLPGNLGNRPGRVSPPCRHQPQ